MSQKSAWWKWKFPSGYINCSIWEKPFKLGLMSSSAFVKFQLWKIVWNDWVRKSKLESPRICFGRLSFKVKSSAVRVKGCLRYRTKETIRFYCSVKQYGNNKTYSVSNQIIIYSYLQCEQVFWNWTVLCVDENLLRVINRQVNQCHRKIIASIFAIILTNVSVKTYTIISVKLHRH